AHEAGHFIAAKAVGMRATQFFFGFGPKLWSFQRGETEYGVKLFPLGGFVRIVGMSYLEEVDPDDLGRTYREKKFWEKSVVVLAGVGTNFLLAFAMFYGVVLANGVFEPIPVAQTVLEDSPADAAGLEAGDVLVRLGESQIHTWDDLTDALRDRGPGPAEVEVLRGGEALVLSIDLAPSDSIPGAGYMGVAPEAEQVDVGPLQGVGVAGRLVGTGIDQTLSALGRLISPSSLAEYLGVFGGDSEVPEEIRVVSVIGIASIGDQMEGAASFFFFMAFLNVMFATVNFFPVLPLDGGHFAIALYEKVTRRQADVRRLIPVAGAVVALLIFLNVVAVILDITNPIQVP
ncbi:MAG: M50 family metallopeptidase, partial [Acidimicrobiia bacterium]|nr:M50 family metallopeptidase [Acidimicrobiia bacterium]